MDLIKALQKEFNEEVETTRKFIKLVPDDKLGWKPHKMSNDFRKLTTHIAALPGWMDSAINADEVNLADPGATNSPQINTREDLISLLEEHITKGRAALEKADINRLEDQWQLKNDGQVLMDITRYEMIRHAFSQLTHHRAQLGVYFRLNNIKVPESYGPTADSGQ